MLHLHGGGGSPQNSIDTTGLVEAADVHGFIVAFPQGTPIAVPLPGGVTGYVWNAGSCCAVAAREGIDDVNKTEINLAGKLDDALMTGEQRGLVFPDVDVQFGARGARGFTPSGKARDHGRR